MNYKLVDLYEFLDFIIQMQINNVLYVDGDRYYEFTNDEGKIYEDHIKYDYMTISRSTPCQWINEYCLSNITDGTSLLIKKEDDDKVVAVIEVYKEDCEDRFEGYGEEPILELSILDLTEE